MRAPIDQLHSEGSSPSCCAATFTALRHVLLGAMAVVPFLAATTSHAAEPTSQPNFVFIMTDDK